MSKERRRRREERERVAALRAAERAEAEAKARRRRERRERLTRPLSRRSSGRRGRAGGVLAERQRQRTRLLIAALVAGNVLVWVFWPDPAGRALVAVVSLLAVPFLHTVFVRR